MHLLSIENLVAGYGNLRVLHGVSLHVERGEIVTVLGANGAGKSTLLRAVSRLIPVMSGTILYEGKNIIPCKPHAVAKMGCSHVPEGRGIFGNLTVMENLLLATYAGKKDLVHSRQAQAVFDLFPVLGQRRRQLASTLSGGEQQMLAIGRAIMSDGELFVFDEPSMGLSPLFVKNVFSTIAAINKKGKTILLVEQNATMALEISHRAYVLENGTIAAEGNSNDIANNETLRHAYLG
jgi:branched-chain amino acid transport system ATP-binding protein